nr:armadillo repeat-containing protein 10 [Anolis sagrei ordinatus]
MRDSALKAGLVGLAVGAGVCWALYGLASRRRRRRKGADPGEREPSALLRAASALPLVSNSSGQREAATPQQAGIDFPNSPHGLGTDDLQNLIYLLESTKDSAIQEQVLITLSNSAAFSINQDTIRNLGGLPVVGKMLSVPVANIKEKALNALNNLSMNIENQEVIKAYIARVCEETCSAPLNSELQLAGLRLLTNMSVTNNYHSMMISSIPGFLYLLSAGNERTQVHVLRVLVNLSANPAMTEHLLKAQAPFLLSLFDSCTKEDVLLRLLVFVTNLAKHMKKDKNTVHYEYNEDSVFSVLWGDSTLCAQKLASLFHHHDMEVREQVAKLISQQC